MRGDRHDPQFKKRVIPRATLTKVAEAEAIGATRVQLDVPREGVIEYYTTPLFDTETNLRERGKPDWVTGKYRLLPVVRCGDGSLWPEANLWILDSLESKPFPNMHTYASIAADLAAFRRYIEAEDIDWLNFPAYKLRRPTYRFNAALISSVELGEIAHSTAKRQMATVIRFYRWLMREQVFKPEHPPWSESDRYVGWTNDYGAEKVLPVVTTDVSINIPSEEDTPVGYINDDGRLRPLPESEQKILLQALKDIDNTEMALIHVFALETGARTQTALTLRVKHVWRSPSEIFGDELRLRAGPGTGIDTKRDRRGILYIPKWLYERLHIYARSERARKRRLRAVGGDNPDQFLF
ncbi:site-specific integrase [Cupriavidus basilensis]